MKKLLLGMAMLVSANAFAVQFTMNLNCNIVAGAKANCTVTNNLPYPIVCSVSGNGVTYYGAWITLQGSGTLQPGRSANVWVNANNPYNDPLVSAHATADCHN